VALAAEVLRGPIKSLIRSPDPPLASDVCAHHGRTRRNVNFIASGNNLPTFPDDNIGLFADPREITGLVSGTVVRKFHGSCRSRGSRFWITLERRIRGSRVPGDLISGRRKPAFVEFTVLTLKPDSR